MSYMGTPAINKLKGRQKMLETIGLYLTFLVAGVSVALELFEVAALMTKDKSDDEEVSKWKKGWAKIRVALEFFPHVKIPVTRGLVALIAQAKLFLKPKQLEPEAQPEPTKAKAATKPVKRKVKKKKTKKKV